jgi:hypothetical protein
VVWSNIRLTNGVACVSCNIMRSRSDMGARAHVRRAAALVGRSCTYTGTYSNTQLLLKLYIVPNGSNTKHLACLAKQMVVQNVLFRCHAVCSWMSSYAVPQTA